MVLQTVPWRQRLAARVRARHARRHGGWAASVPLEGGDLDVEDQTGALGGWLLAAGLLGWALLNAVVAAGLRGPTRQPVSWRATSLVTVQVAALPIVAAGWLLIADRDGGLYWLVAGTLLCLLAATGNAWVLLVEIVRDERYLPVEPGAR